MQRPPRSTLFPYTTHFRSKMKPKGAGFELVSVDGGPFNRTKLADHSLIANVAVTDIEFGVDGGAYRLEEHTSELQSRQYLVCRLLLGKKHHIPILHLFHHL